MGREQSTLSEFTDSNANLTWTPSQTHPEIMVKSAPWAPPGPAKLIHRINHHSVLAFHPCHKLAFLSSFQRNLVSEFEKESTTAPCPRSLCTFHKCLGLPVMQRLFDWEQNHRAHL